MQYIFSIIFAGLLVTAQSCWKLSVGRNAELFSGHGFGLSKLLNFAFAPLTLAGILLYVIATGLYMYLLSKYQFSTVQAMVITLSLLLSVGIAVAFFGDRLGVVNFLGVGLIVVGIVLINVR